MCLPQRGGILPQFGAPRGVDLGFLNSSARLRCSKSSFQTADPSFLNSRVPWRCSRVCVHRPAQADSDPPGDLICPGAGQLGPQTELPALRSEFFEHRRCTRLFRKLGSAGGSGRTHSWTSFWSKQQSLRRPTEPRQGKGPGAGQGPGARGLDAAKGQARQGQVRHGPVRRDRGRRRTIR